MRAIALSMCIARIGRFKLPQLKELRNDKQFCIGKVAFRQMSAIGTYAIQ